MTKKNSIKIIPLGNKSGDIKIGISNGEKHHNTASFLKWFKTESNINTIKNILYITSGFTVFIGFIYQVYQLSKFGILWAFSPQQIITDAWIIGIPFSITCLIFIFWGYIIYILDREMFKNIKEIRKFKLKMINFINLNGNHFSKSISLKNIDGIMKSGVTRDTPFEDSIRTRILVISIFHLPTIARFFKKNYGIITLIFIGTIAMVNMLTNWQIDKVNIVCYKVDLSATVCSSGSLQYMNDKWSVFSDRENLINDTYNYIAIPTLNIDKIMIKNGYQ